MKERTFLYRWYDRYIEIMYGKPDEDRKTFEVAPGVTREGDESWGEVSGDADIVIGARV